MVNSVNVKRGTYVILVEGNGNGHITQMKEVIEKLKHMYTCVGIVVGREKTMATEYAVKNYIPILNLREPLYVSDENTDVLVNETLAYVLEYGLYHYSTVSQFIISKSPEFIINLHLPIKIMSVATRIVFNISTQNRLNFDVDYDAVASEKEI